MSEYEQAPSPDQRERSKLELVLTDLSYKVTNAALELKEFPELEVYEKLTELFDTEETERFLTVNSLTEGLRGQYGYAVNSVLEKKFLEE